jgi:hypothetical protein
MSEGTESEPRKERASGASVSEDDPAGGASGLADDSSGAADATPKIGGSEKQGQTTVPAPDEDANKGPDGDDG